MWRAWTLGSGSAGNALVLEADGARLLVDCGFGPRALAARLKAVGIAPESIRGLVVTHEHVDHAQGVLRAQHKWRWPVLASAGTLDALGGVAERWRRMLRPGAPLRFEGFHIEGFSVPHDAAAPMAMRITAEASGARAGLAHDLGAVPDDLRGAFRDLDLLCVEANHDVEMLRNGPYPPRLQERIRGGRGHLSNAQAAQWLADIAGRATRDVVLLHLSEQNNTPALAERVARDALRRSGARAEVRAAPRRLPTVVAGVNGRRETAVQMTLAF